MLRLKRPANPPFCDGEHSRMNRGAYCGDQRKEACKRNVQEKNNVRPRGFWTGFPGSAVHRSAILLAAGDGQGLSERTSTQTIIRIAPWACCSSSVPRPGANFRQASKSMRKRWPGCHRNSPTPIARIARHSTPGCPERPGSLTQFRPEIGSKIRTGVSARPAETARSR